MTRSYHGLEVLSLRTAELVLIWLQNASPLISVDLLRKALRSSINLQERLKLFELILSYSVWTRTD